MLPKKQREELLGRQRVGGSRSRPRGGRVKELRPLRRHGASPVWRGYIIHSKLDVQERSGGMSTCKGETGAVWPRTRLQHNIVVSELSRTKRDLET
jgi:hypothetical protein